MAYNDPQLLHLDAMLTQVSVGWTNDDFVADVAIPSLRVAKQSNKYYVFDRATWGRQTDDIRAPGARAAELPQMSLSRDAYFAQEHSLVGWVTPEEQQNADDPLQPLVDETTRVTNTILLNREKEKVDMIQTTANYAAGYTTALAGANQWDQYATSVPISDVKAGRSKIHDGLFRDPNVAICQYQVAVKLEDHTSFINRIQYAQVGVTNDQLIAELMGVPTFKRAGAGLVTSAYGATEAVGYMWGKNFWLGYVTPTPGTRMTTYAYEFVWPYPTGDSQITERWFDIDRKVDLIRVSHRRVLKLISLNSIASQQTVAAYLITTAIA